MAGKILPKWRLNISWCIIVKWVIVIFKIFFLFLVYWAQDIESSVQLAFSTLLWIDTCKKFRPRQCIWWPLICLWLKMVPRSNKNKGQLVEISSCCFFFFFQCCWLPSKVWVGRVYAGLPGWLKLEETDSSGGGKEMWAAWSWLSGGFEMIRDVSLNPRSETWLLLGRWLYVSE